MPRNLFPARTIYSGFDTCACAHTDSQNLPVSSPILLTISTPDGPIHGLWRPSSQSRAAVLLLPGVDGALTGPANLYTELAPALHRTAVVAQLGYDQPGALEACRDGVLSALDAFSRQGVERVALIGWDFGGAVAIAAGARSPLVTGVACLAPDPSASDDIATIGPRRLLLAHGSEDRAIPQSVSILLHSLAGESSELALYPGEAHDFTRARSSVLRRLILWSAALLSTPFRPGGQPASAPRRQPALAGSR